MKTDKFKYHVIWIDDKYKEYDGFITNAAMDGVGVTPFEYGKDGLRALVENIDYWDGVVLDVKCCFEEGDLDRAENFYKVREELQTIKFTKRPSLPYYVYSAQPDILSNSMFIASLNGKKLYELAREGKEIERKARPIVVHEIEILSENMPEFTIRIKCSKGTYIRTICHDIGQKLSCGGAMVSLKRTKVGNFGIEDSYTLSRIEDMAKEGRLCEILLPVEKVFEKLPEIRVKEETMKALLNGNQLRREDFLSLSEEALKAEEVRVYGSDGRFYGVYGYQEGRKLFCPIKMFFPEQAER